MKLKFWKKVNPEGAAMRARLGELRREYRGNRFAMECLEGFQLYADMGKDRDKLGMDWAVRAEKACEEAIEMDKMFSGLTA